MLVRYWRHDHIREVRTSRVIVDDARGLLLWIPDGAPMMRAQTRDGDRPRRLADQLAAEWEIVPATWRGPGVLMFFPAGAAAYSVWWFFHADGDFRGWYVNLEEPAIRWEHGVDTVDHALDIWAEPGGAWRWKDEDEFAERTGHEWYWDAEQAAEIRGEGERVVKLIEAAEFPFDGSWCDFAPDPAWPLPQLPRGWDRPRA
ncbi:MAG: DUF402 domain-containing protein [Micromonosporaceae bacterium]